MKRIAVVTAVLVSMASLPAFAEEREPVRGSEQDPFSQTYTGIRERSEPSPGQRDRKEPSACACPHGHDAQGSGPHKA